MSTASAKAKGRRWQQEVELQLKIIFPHLEGNDILSRPMGSQGSDLILSTEALKVLPYDFEMKNQESSKIWKDIRQSETRLDRSDMYPVLMLRRNFLRGPLKQGIAIIPFAHYCSLLCQHQVTCELDHILSAARLFDFLDKILPAQAEAALCMAAQYIHWLMTQRPVIVNDDGSLIINENRVRLHSSSTLNIWAEFTGQPILFDRGDSRHTIYIAITAFEFYGLLKQIESVK